MQISVLNLSGQGLHVVHVGSLKSLLRLDLSQNFLRTLNETGIEQLDLLESLSIADNLFKVPKRLCSLGCCRRPLMLPVLKYV